MKRKPCKRLTGWRYWAERLLGLRAQRLSELLEQRRRATQRLEKQLSGDLKSVIERVAGCVTDSQPVEVADLESLVRAARLLCDVHEMADSGQLDGVDLVWMVAADDLIVPP